MPEYRPQPDNGDIENVWAFGLRPGGCLGYYIGLDWLDEPAKIALRVEPKIAGIDYLSMFQTCLASPAAGRYLGQAYDIRVEKPFVPCQDDRFDFTPILLHHYLVLLKDLVKKPLRKGYVTRRDNLTAKIKGKILMDAHIKTNIFGMRPDRVMCSYQEFSTDCIENRLLHSAYRMSLLYLSFWSLHKRHRPMDLRRYEGIAALFQGIGLIEKSQELSRVKSNPLYREYGEALRLARLIYLIKGYRDSHHDKHISLIPPYVIDMSKLFELFVYHLLHAALGSRISFQKSGKYGTVDFLDLGERTIIDAKYKLAYARSYYVEDIRQVAGYARDIGILKALAIQNRDEVVPCIIIYPNKKASDNLLNCYATCREEISQFHKMYKLAVRLPVVQDPESSMK